MLFKCEGQLANLEYDTRVRNVGLGYTDGLSSLDGMRKISLVPDEDPELNINPEKLSKSKVY